MPSDWKKVEEVRDYLSKSVDRAEDSENYPETQDFSALEKQAYAGGMLKASIMIAVGRLEILLKHWEE